MGHFDDVNSPHPEGEPLSPAGLERAIEEISNLTPEQLVEYSEKSYGKSKRLLAMRACDALITTSDDYLTVLPRLWDLYDEVATAHPKINQLDRFMAEFQKMNAQQLYDRAEFCYKQGRTPELVLIEKELTQRESQITPGNSHNFDETIAEEAILITDYLEQVRVWLHQAVTEDSSL